MISKKVRVTLICETPSERSIKQGFLIRILKYKYKRASERLQGILTHLNTANYKEKSDSLGSS